MTKIDEPTVRLCIEAVDAVRQANAGDKQGVRWACYSASVEALEALLPKPVDQAAELVEKFEKQVGLSGLGSCHEIRMEVTRWLLDNLHLIQPRKEWSEEEIMEAADSVADRDDAIRRGIEMGRQLAPVEPVAPLTNDEIVKEAREWCAKTDPETLWRTGKYDGCSKMKTVIAIITAWKGKK